ncbi:Amastin surface glycoprotein [Trypanosoma melophagium]|uniref:Amastin surface glycoprotein n=1 Tax=Trypanosoma melophagium TaxID=715481 RepID=UPI003519F555|nr:Amastin surface glycoprotein [Trypanosoma melophagium]
MAEVNLWNWHEWPPGSNNTSQKITKILRLDYFTCDAGKLRIQVVEGMAIIACILCLANFVMSVFLFCYPIVLRLPLSLYFMLAALASAAILILMTWWYTKSWCDTQLALSKDKNYSWEYGIGWKLIIASCGSSVVGCILAAMSC